MTELVGVREQVVAAYQADPTLTVRQLQDRFKVGKSTISRWLQQAGATRPRGARKGAPMRSRLTPVARIDDPLAANSPADDFQRWLVGWYGEGRVRRVAQQTTGTQWVVEHSHGGVIQSPEAYALTCRAVGKSWRAIALDLLTENGGDPTDPALLRRAALGAVDLKRRVKRRLTALEQHPAYAAAVREFRTNWLDGEPKWMVTRSRRGERD